MPPAMALGALLGALAVALPAGGDHAPWGPSQGADVLILNPQFAPAVVVARPGDLVTWKLVQQDPDTPHTVTSDDDLDGVPSAADGATFDFQTAVEPVPAWRVPEGGPRVIAYYCLPHIYVAMRGVIVVA